MLRPADQLVTQSGCMDHHYWLEGPCLTSLLVSSVLGDMVQMFLLLVTIKKLQIISWHHTFASIFYKEISNMCNSLTIYTSKIPCILVPSSTLGGFITSQRIIVIINISEQIIHSQNGLITKIKFLYIHTCLSQWGFPC